MSVLSIIQSHCRMHALNVPSSVVGSTDTQTSQLLEILKEVLEELVTESKFQVTTQEALFSAVPMEDQGALTDLAPFGYQFAIFETFYDRTLGQPLYGPLNETQWQELKALVTSGPFFKFRIMQDHLLLNPVPTAPFSDMAFEYMSSWAVKSSEGVLQATIIADDDGFVFPENILRKGMMFRWKQIKGLPYQADQQQFNNLLNNYISKDKVKRRVDLANGMPVDIQPGVFVPAGNWLR